MMQKILFGKNGGKLPLSPFYTELMKSIKLPYKFVFFANMSEGNFDTFCWKKPADWMQYQKISKCSLQL